MGTIKNHLSTEFDDHYLHLAFAERKNSDDPKALKIRQSGVGAVLVGKHGILAQSANVLPPALKDYQKKNRTPVTEEERYHFIEHAERSAIFQALNTGQLLHGSTLYCTRFPCSDCARAIVWGGIRRVVLASGYKNEDRWLESQKAARDILRRARIKVRVVSDKK